jgi:redox-sensing transcriptional repressor
MADLSRTVRERAIEIGIVAVPADAAQAVTDRLIDAGVTGILNFAPVRLEVHDRVSIISVDFSVSLEQLAFQVSLGLKGSLE